jgi:hypothetical protein
VAVPTIDDIAARLGRPVDDTVRAEAIIDDTMAMVRAYVGLPLADVPADIFAVICQIVGRALGRPADEAGITQESIGSYSYSVGAAAAAGAVGLLNDERAVLDRHRIVVGVTRMDDPS